MNGGEGWNSEAVLDAHFGAPAWVARSAAGGAVASAVRLCAVIRDDPHPPNADFVEYYGGFVVLGLICGPEQSPNAVISVVRGAVEDGRLLAGALVGAGAWPPEARAGGDLNRAPNSLGVPRVLRATADEPAVVLFPDVIVTVGVLGVVARYIVGGGARGVRSGWAAGRRGGRMVPRPAFFAAPGDILERCWWPRASWMLREAIPIGISVQGSFPDDALAAVGQMTAVLAGGAGVAWAPRGSRRGGAPLVWRCGEPRPRVEGGGLAREIQTPVSNPLPPAVVARMEFTAMGPIRAPAALGPLPFGWAPPRVVLDETATLGRVVDALGGVEAAAGLEIGHWGITSLISLRGHRVVAGPDGDDDAEAWEEQPAPALLVRAARELTRQLRHCWALEVEGDTRGEPETVSDTEVVLRLVCPAGLWHVVEWAAAGVENAVRLESRTAFRLSVHSTFRVGPRMPVSLAERAVVQDYVHPGPAGIDARTGRRIGAGAPLVRPVARITDRFTHALLRAAHDDARPWRRLAADVIEERSRYVARCAPRAQGAAVTYYVRASNHPYAPLFRADIVGWSRVQTWPGSPEAVVVEDAEVGAPPALRAEATDMDGTAVGSLALFRPPDRRTGAMDAVDVADHELNAATLRATVHHDPAYTTFSDRLHKTWVRLGDGGDPVTLPWPALQQPPADGAVHTHLLAISGDCGAGKSTASLRLIRDFLATHGRNSVIVVVLPRRSLFPQFLRLAAAQGIPAFDGRRDASRHKGRVALTTQLSLYSLLIAPPPRRDEESGAEIHDHAFLCDCARCGDGYRALFFDESVTTLATDPRGGLGDPVRTNDALNRVLASAKNRLIVAIDAYADLVELFANLVERGLSYEHRALPRERWLQRRYAVSTYRATFSPAAEQGRRVEVVTVKEALSVCLARVKAALDAGENVAMFFASLRELQTRREALRLLYGGDDGAWDAIVKREYHSESADVIDTEQFVADGVRLFMYTTAAGCGVDLTFNRPDGLPYKYFSTMVVWGAHRVYLSPFDVQQAINRARWLDRVIIPAPAARLLTGVEFMASASVEHTVRASAAEVVENFRDTREGVVSALARMRGREAVAALVGDDALFRLPGEEAPAAAGVDDGVPERPASWLYVALVALGSHYRNLGRDERLTVLVAMLKRAGYAVVWEAPEVFADALMDAEEATADAVIERYEEQELPNASIEPANVLLAKFRATPLPATCASAPLSAAVAACTRDPSLLASYAGALLLQVLEPRTEDEWAQALCSLVEVTRPETALPTTATVRDGEIRSALFVAAGADLGTVRALVLHCALRLCGAAGDEFFPDHIERIVPDAASDPLPCLRRLCDEGLIDLRPAPEWGASAARFLREHITGRLLRASEGSMKRGYDNERPVRLFVSLEGSLYRTKAANRGKRGFGDAAAVGNSHRAVRVLAYAALHGATTLGVAAAAGDDGHPPLLSSEAHRAYLAGFDEVAVEEGETLAEDAASALADAGVCDTAEVVRAREVRARVGRKRARDDSNENDDNH